MKSFLRTLLAILFADALVVALFALVLAAKTRETPTVEPGCALVQTIDGDVPEYAPPGGFPSFGGPPASQTSILENLEKARHDKRIHAVVLRLGAIGMGFAKLDEVQERISQLRRAGKPVWAYTEFLTNRSLYLASACDSVFLLRNGYVGLHGFASGMPFVKGTLQKLGIKDNLHKIEKYKSAAELVQRTDMSPEARANIDWMLDAYYPNFLRTIEEGRRLAPGTLEAKALSQGVLLPREALEAGLVDRLVYWDEVESSLLKLPGIKAAKKTPKGLEPRPRVVRGEAYAKIPRGKAGIRAKKKIAIVHAQGLIAGEKSGTALALGTTMGAGTMEEAFRQAAADKDLAAIIFRVDSGGGESSTSWRIGRAAIRAGAVKPLVVSVSDVAASGAYMISYPCSTLVADRLSVVGSIGSISGKFNLHGLYDKLGITMDFVTRGPNSLIDSDYFDYTPEQYESMTSRHWTDYYEWVDDIARCRHMTRAQVDSVGRGRVWTGEQALQRGLIDTLGTLDTAVQIAKRKAGIPAQQEVAFVHYPKPPSPLEALKGGGVAAAIRALIQSTLAPLQREATWAVDWNSRF